MVEYEKIKQTYAMAHFQLSSPLKFFTQLLKPYPGDIIKTILAVFMTTAAILGVGYGLRQLVDQGFSAENQHLLNLSALTLFGLASVLSFSAYLRTSTTSLLAEKITNDLRQRLFNQTLALPFTTYESLKLGGILSTLSTDTDQIRQFTSGSAAVAIRTVLQLLGATTLLIYQSPKLSLYVFTLLPLVLVPLFFFGRKVKTLTKDVQEQEGVALSFAEERINALSTLKAFGAEPNTQEIFSQQMHKKMSLIRPRTHYRSLLISLVILLVFSSIAAVLWLGALEVMDDKLSPGQLSAFVFYAIIVAGSLNNFADVIANMTQTFGALDRVIAFLNYKREDQNISSEILKPFKSLYLDNIKFTYPMRPETLVLKGISLALSQKQKVAIVGPSGSGKSTIFKLLLQFYQPDSGEITLDKSPYTKTPLQGCRSLFALVPQDPVIFNASILENIKIANPNAATKEIKKALYDAHILEFSDRFPHGLETILGEKGVRLSGGQKQRIALARALLKNAPIMLLDEATNALDSESERHIQQALQGSLKNKAALIIAHRLSTVKEADEIILLEDGLIQARGTHKELMNSSPLYKKLAKQQFLD